MLVCLCVCYDLALTDLAAVTGVVGAPAGLVACSGRRLGVEVYERRR